MMRADEYRPALTFDQESISNLQRRRRVACADRVRPPERLFHNKLKKLN
jgi:hypothetical protein